MKVLILVMSYDDGGVFTDFMNAQIKTWAINFVHGVKTIFYYGGSESRREEDDLPWCSFLNLNCSDEYYMMHWKTKLALDFALKMDDWDIIFRTNGSSYINKSNLLKFCKELPVGGNMYGGWYNNDRFVSGAGIFLNRNSAALLSSKLKEMLTYEEDVLYGDIFKSIGIKNSFDDRSRLDWPKLGKPGEYKKAYHIRFKSDEDRKKDIESMYFIHNKIFINEIQSRAGDI